MSFVNSIPALCRMIKIEHSIFALPFAYSGALLAAEGNPGFRVMFFLTLAMVAVRTFAMTMNRIVDVDYDRQNPRTQQRHLVTGEITMAQAKQFATVSAIIFMLACTGLNSLCFKLGPVALALSAGYSYVKRFSWLCHFVLGAVLGMAPFAGWVAVTGTFAVIPWLLFLGVVFWVAGFDILYATQDIDFDKNIGLHSVPAFFGIPAALIISSFCHVNTSIFLFMTGYAAQLSLFWYLVLIVVSLVLLHEHRILSPTDLTRVNAAFFTMNGVVSLLVFVGVLFAV